MNYALPTIKKYPLDNISDIKKAELYFLEYEKNIPIEFRREFCTNLLQAQDNLCLPVHTKIAHYASKTLSKLGLNQSIRLREHFLGMNEPAKSELLDIIKTAENVENVLNKFITFDRKHRLDMFWDSKMPNPLLGILEARPDNQPEVYEGPTYKATGDQVRNLRYHKTLLQEHFSDTLVERFCSDPISVLKSLKPWEQDIILNLADNEIYNR